MTEFSRQPYTIRGFCQSLSPHVFVQIRKGEALQRRSIDSNRGLYTIEMTRIESKGWREGDLNSTDASTSGNDALLSASAHPGERTNDSGEAVVLDRFWYSRGIVDDGVRKRLVDASLNEVVDSSRFLGQSLEDVRQDEEYVLPGVSSTWDIQSSLSTFQSSTSRMSELPKEILLASQRIVDLHRFLGSREDVDVVWMVQREPKLLQTSARQLAARLLALRVDDAAHGVDIAKLAERQPSLLLSELKKHDDTTNDTLLEGWQYGLISGDGSEQWKSHFLELEAYKSVHGDCHAGFRDGDSKVLKRWCKKQRDEFARGNLSGEKKNLLESIGFEFNEEQAEWLRWFGEYLAVKSSKETNLTKPEDFYLINWCAIQRIARRSRVLPDEREVMLTSAGFDWNEPDALS